MGNAPQHCGAIRRALLAWFRRHARPLPWRETRDAYRIWVAEVMLQQTQIDTVIPFYERFLARFPNVERLAEAPLERVLELWSGLGYYRRARSLHQAAREIVARFEGRFPADFEQARSLPGVGAYTAGAVLSIAYNLPHAVVDGNVARVVARLLARQGSLQQPEFRRAVEREAQRLLSRRRPGDFNQALMQLGQTICLPRGPQCPRCPLPAWCAAYREGKPESYPAPRPRRPTERRYLASALILRDGRGPGPPHHPPAPSSKRRGIGEVASLLAEVAPLLSKEGVGGGCGRTIEVLMVRGLDEGLLGDLWNFPGAFGDSRRHAMDRLRKKVADALASPVRWGRRSAKSARLRHGITYRAITVDIYPASVSNPALSDSLRWFSVANLNQAAISQLARKIAVYLA